MPSIEAFGAGFDLNVMSMATNQIKEEFQHGNESFICSQVGEAFKVVVSCTRRTANREQVKCRIRLDGTSPGWCVFGNASKTTHTFHGWWVDGSGSRFRSFEFGAPNEDASRGGTGDHLRIEMELTKVRTTNTPRPPPSYSLPATQQNCVKKPFQPHVTVGKELTLGKSVKVANKGLNYTKVGPTVVLTLRYTTAIGLQIRNIISHHSHPHLFPPLPKEEDDEKPKVVTQSSLGDVVDLTQDAPPVVKTESENKVKREIDNDVTPQQLKKLRSEGNSKDMPIDLT